MGSRSGGACWVLPLTSGFLGLHRAQDKAGRGEGRLVCPLQGRRARDSEVLAVKEEVGGRSGRGQTPPPVGRWGRGCNPLPIPGGAGGASFLGGWKRRAWGRSASGVQGGCEGECCSPQNLQSNKLHSFWTVVCITGRKVKPQNECVLLVFLSHRTSASSKDSPVCTSGRLLCPLSSSRPGALWGGPTGAVPGRRRGGPASSRLLLALPALPALPAAGGGLCSSPVHRQKLPYECGSFPEPPVGETWEGTGSHPRGPGGPPGPVLTEAKLLQRHRSIGWRTPDILGPQ